MTQEPKRAQQQSIFVLLIVVATISGLAFRPVTAHADTGPVVADGLEVHLAEVPLYSQLDNAAVEWTSCGPTSLAMVLNYYLDGPSPQAIIEYATSHVGQDGELLYKPHDPDKVFTSPRHLYEIAQHYANPAQGWVLDDEGARQQLRALLADGLPVVVDVTVALAKNGSTAAHFVAVTGIDADNTVYVNDPYGQGWGGQRRAVAWEDFYWAWQNNGDGHIGGHGWWMVAEMPAESPSVASGETARGGEIAPAGRVFSVDGLFILADPLALHVDAEMCVLNGRVLVV
jgi:uncharacterized protein YvpB